MDFTNSDQWHLESRAHIVAEAADSNALNSGHFHHLFNVRRLAVGEKVTICDGMGTVRLAEVVPTTSREPGSRKGRRDLGLSLAGIGSAKFFDPPEFNIEMVLAMIDFTKLEVALAKLTELGVSAITLVETRRSVSVAGGSRRVSSERVMRVLREAGGQCRSVYLPKVTFQSLEDVMERVTVCDRGARRMETRPRALLIGPEGGFERGEIPDEFPRVSLPGHVLRAETAAVAAAAIALSFAPTSK